AAECLAHGVMPAVVPQLKTITLGGAVAGVGIESSSHRHGLVHDSMLEIEVLLGDGRIVTCAPDNEHADLFFGFPNSYGTLGYALRVKVKTVPVKPFVRLQHTEFKNPLEFFEELGGHLEAGEADFIDGTVFNPGQFFITLGSFADSAPYTSDYTYEKIYYQSIRGKREDYLTVHDYLWRWNSRVGATRWIERLAGLHSESVIQDVDIPLARAGEFFEFYARAIGLWPQWICPIGPAPGSGRFTLYPMRPDWYVNFGFWDVK